MVSELPGLEVDSLPGGVSIEHSVPVRIMTPQRTIEFCQVTDAEIEVYASTGWAATILLTLVGAFGGFALGCVVALMQGGLQLGPKATIATAAWISGITAVLFLVLAVVALLMQRKVSHPWKTSKHSIANTHKFLQNGRKSLE